MVVEESSATKMIEHNLLGECALTLLPLAGHLK